MPSTVEGDVRDASLSHDLRNALNAMTAALSVLELFPPGSAEALEAQQVLARQSARMRAIVDERFPMR